MRSRRGQFAVERVLMYGWVILVVIVGGMIVWKSGILEPGAAMPVKPEITGFSQVVVEDFVISYDGYVDMSVKNYAPSSVTIYQNDVSVEINGAVCQNGPPGDTPVGPGASSRILIDCSGPPAISDSYNEGGPIRANVSIRYMNSDSGHFHNSVGNLHGPVSG